MVFPGDKTMASVMQSSGQASWSMLVIKHPSHALDSGGWSPPLSPSITLTCIQWWLHSLAVGEQSHQCSEDTDLSDVDLLVILNIKGVLGEALGWESTSSPEALFSIGSHTMSPFCPSCDNGKVVVPFCSWCPLCLWYYISPCYGRRVTYALLASTQFSGSLRVQHRCKGLKILVSARTKS